MRECTVDTGLDQSSVFFLHMIVARTIGIIQRTIAEETIDILAALVTRIVFTILVGKELL